jgi:hypothetical protein
LPFIKYRFTIIRIGAVLNFSIIGHIWGLRRSLPACFLHHKLFYRLYGYIPTDTSCGTSNLVDCCSMPMRTHAELAARSCG